MYTSEILLRRKTDRGTLDSSIGLGFVFFFHYALTAVWRMHMEDVTLASYSSAAGRKEILRKSGRGSVVMCWKAACPRHERGREARTA